MLLRRYCRYCAAPCGDAAATLPPPLLLRCRRYCYATAATAATLPPLLLRLVQPPRHLRTHSPRLSRVRYDPLATQFIAITQLPLLILRLAAPLPHAESMKEAHQIMRGVSLRVVDGHQLHFVEVFVALCKYVALLLLYYARVLLPVTAAAAAATTTITSATLRPRGAACYFCYYHYQY